MEIINIKEEQRDRLCEEIAKLTFEYKKDSTIKCIYLTSFVNFDNSENVINITFVTTNEDHLKGKIKDYNLAHQTIESINEFGIRILLDTDIDYKYTINDSVPSEFKRSNYLLNSNILYDEKGRFTKIKSKAIAKMKENNNIYHEYNNLAQIKPPIDNKLAQIMNDSPLEPDPIAVREYSRSRI